MGLTYKEIRKWDGCKMPYPDNFFDFVISSDTLEHVPDYRNYIKEICRVLKPKGKTFVGTERRWFPYFIFWNPHSGLPLTILLPQPIRKFVEERIFGIPNLDYHWFSFFSEIKNEFVKHGVEMRRWKKIQDHCFNRKKRPEILRPIYNLMMLHGLGEKKIEGLC